MVASRTSLPIRMGMEGRIIPRCSTPAGAPPEGCPSPGLEHKPARGQPLDDTPTPDGHAAIPIAVVECRSLIESWQNASCFNWPRELGIALPIPARGTLVRHVDMGNVFLHLVDAFLQLLALDGIQALSFGFACR